MLKTQCLYKKSVFMYMFAKIESAFVMFTLWRRFQRSESQRQMDVRHIENERRADFEDLVLY